MLVDVSLQLLDPAHVDDPLINPELSGLVPLLRDSNQLSQFTPWNKTWIAKQFNQFSALLLFNKSLYDYSLGF